MIQCVNLEFVHNVMKAIIDSNIIISDFRLTSTDYKILLESAKNRNIELYVTEIGIDEVLNKFEERLIEAKSKFIKESS